MKMQKNYGWLDRFRPLAALLVVAIHTSPFASFSADADFFFTRVIARVAVPFFFMVTGHFTLSTLFLSDNADNTGHSCSHGLRRCLLKLCLLYGFAILLYLPLGIYAGHYRGLSIGAILRMLIFDGTFYHLWYFPACILGVLVIFLLSRFCGLRGATVISSLLYAAGLLGDSYFGLAAKVPFLNAAYEAMFHLFSYTRNGLFLAPLFLILGVWVGNMSSLTASRYEEHTTEARPAALRLQGNKSPLPQSLLCGIFLALSFGAMTAEAFLLRFFSLQRHDSMYIFLVPVMFFLYRLLLSLPAAASKKKLRAAALWIYILHPAFIVVVRGAAKLLHLTAVLVDNSLLHYLTVALLSAASGIFLALLQDKITVGFPGRFKPAPGESLSHQTRSGSTGKVVNLWTADAPLAHRAWLELDMDALAHNVRFLQSRLPAGCRLMPAVKANAYGHGAVPVAKELNRLGVDSFCVACASEGVALRKAGVKGEILILGYTSPDLFPLLRRYRLTQTVLDHTYGECLHKSGIRLHVHIAVDTGMHRLGIRCEDTEQIAAVYGFHNLVVDGIYTHLSACDSNDPESRAFTECQIAAFFQVIESLRAKGCDCRGLHLLSSYGILNYPEAAADYVRPGIALYGLLSRDEDFHRIFDTRNAETDGPSLRPVLSLKAQVSSLRTLHSGESAGYGLSFTADRDMRLAVLSIGYADGLPRALSDGNGRVLINGYSAPILGRVCMDQTLVDVSRIPNVAQGDTAVLIGISAMQEITAGELAARCGTITNEILSRLGERLERICV